MLEWLLSKNMIILMVLYIFYGKHTLVLAVDSRGIYKFQYIGIFAIFDIVWASETKDWLIQSMLPLLLISTVDMPQISQ